MKGQKGQKGQTEGKTERNPWLKRFCIPLAFVAAHGALVAAAAWIYLVPGWDDENPSILLGLFLKWVDYPVIAALDLAGVTPKGPGIILLAVAGSAYWFALGMLLQWVIGPFGKRSA